MPRSSGRRGQVEPLAALAAVAAVGAALALYAGVLNGVLAAQPDAGPAETALDRVHRAASTASVVEPGRLGTAVAARPKGYHLNATVTVDGHRWHAGPAPPSGADVDAAGRLTGVRLGPDRIRPGRFRVEVWR